MGATVRCEPESIELEPIAVPSAITWPAAPAYDALRVRVRRAGSVLASDLETSARRGTRAPPRACVEREQRAVRKKPTRSRPRSSDDLRFVPFVAAELARTRR